MAETLDVYGILHQNLANAGCNEKDSCLHKLHKKRRMEKTIINACTT